MEKIRNKDGVVIHTSKNLAGIIQFVSKPENVIKTLDISQVGKGEGLLSILFENGDSYQAHFNSFIVLKSFVWRWDNVQGCKFLVNGKEFGVVSKDNPVLTGTIQEELENVK
jgi:hypothetical protein